jgi:hypothetical protein
MIHAWIGSRRLIDGSTISCTLASTRSSDQGPLATKCSSFWCCTETLAGAVVAASGSALLRPSAANSPVQ